MDSIFKFAQHYLSWYIYKVYVENRSQKLLNKCATEAYRQKAIGQ